MNKKEFIARLRAALNGRIAPSLVEENVNYYQDYINGQIRGGKSEAEVMSALGDPRLIARTIVETSPTTEGENKTFASSGNTYGESVYRSSGQTSNTAYQDERHQTGYKSFRMPGWLMVLLSFLIFCLIISAILSVLSFLAPVLIAIMAVMFLIKLFRDWLN